MSDIKLGRVLIEGKTKIVYELTETPGQVLLQSKDRITAGDGAKAHNLEGKAAISTATTSAIFELLNNAGIKTHFVKRHSDTSFIARRCEMIPIEWVTRRIATGSFLKRNPGVREGYRFCPPKLETFFKDDANHDPQWSREQLIEAKLNVGGVTIGTDEYEILAKSTVTIFEILEKSWASVDCTLVDMKIEFGVQTDTGELVLADVIDSDSWRLWPAGDRRLMKDKQVYRELKDVTPEALETVKRNFAWVAERVALLSPKPHARVVVIMGSPTDTGHCEKICAACRQYGVPCEMRVCSAHKATDEALNILAEYEGEGIPTVFVAVAGRSNGLGPVLSGNSAWPVINCPPLSSDWAAQDVWSSLHLPSGLGCGTVLSAEAAALNAAQILGLSDHVIWSKLRASQLNTWIGLKMADKKVRKD